MLETQKDTQDLSFVNLKEFRDNMILITLDSVSNDIDKLNQRVTTLEEKKELWKKPSYPDFFYPYGMQRKNKAKKEIYPVIKDTMQDCKNIIERALEILSDWREVQDIRLQIQYAAIITGKIDNLKKISYIQTDDTKKKICTLLRNVIRINVTDSVFSREQIELIKKGLELLLSEQIKKEDMLQLNRDFLKKHLMTMPAWE